MKTDTTDNTLNTAKSIDNPDVVATPTPSAVDRHALLTHRGSWLSADHLIELPYDFETGRRPWPAVMPRALSTLHNVSSAADAPFALPDHAAGTAHLINAMGIMLGDSIIGLTALHWLRRARPDLKLVLYRPAASLDYVEQLYRLAASPGIGTVRHLPWPVTDIEHDAHIIDIGNIVFWPSFATTPMIDFFLEALGLDPAHVPPDAKANRWLADLPLPALPAPWVDRPYVLFNPDASTPIRRIPPAFHAAWIDRLWDTYRLPVLGFAPIQHPHYVSIQALSPDTPAYLSWIRHARALVTADSAAVHAAAGFDVPTTAIFTTIDPTLRVRDYPRCQAFDLSFDAVRGLHQSDAPELLAQVEQAWRAVELDGIALPIADTTPLNTGAAAEMPTIPRCR